MSDIDSVAGPSLDKQNEEENCPKCGRKKHDKKYKRSKSERKKALLRDADDPNADLSDEARALIKKNGGASVPPGYEVSHEEPLYTKPKEERCELDVADNMKTQPKPEHKARHKRSGDQYHDYPR
jgi:hypothetical protein